jgi:hypothetical protein
MGDNDTLLDAITLCETLGDAITLDEMLGDGITDAVKFADVLDVGDSVSDTMALGDADTLGDCGSMSSAHCAPEHVWLLTVAWTLKTLALGLPAADNVELRSDVSCTGDNIVTEENWVAKVCVCASDAEAGATMYTTYTTCCNARPPCSGAARSRLKPQFVDAVTHPDGT